jgi:hypothetical protein
MKRSRIFLGLTAGLLSIGLVLAGCEGPTGADGGPGSGGGSPGNNAPNIVSSFAGLKAAVADGHDIVYVVGNNFTVDENYVLASPLTSLIVTSNANIADRSVAGDSVGKVTIAAGKTLTTGGVNVIVEKGAQVVVPATAHLDLSGNSVVTVEGAAAALDISGEAIIGGTATLTVKDGAALAINDGADFVAQTGTFVNVDADSSLTVGDTGVGFDISESTGTIDSSHSSTVSGATGASTVKYISANNSSQIANAFSGGAVKVFYSGTNPIDQSVLTSARTIVVTSPVSAPVAQSSALTVAGKLIVNEGAKILTSSSGAITVTNAATSILTNNGTIVAGTAITKETAGVINGSGDWTATAEAAINPLFAFLPEVTAATDTGIVLASAGVTIPSGKTLVVTGTGIKTPTGSSFLVFGEGRYTVSSGNADHSAAISGSLQTLTIAGTGTPTLTIGGANGIVIGNGTWTGAAAATTFASFENGTATAVQTGNGTFKVTTGGNLTVGTGSVWTGVGAATGALSTLTGVLTNNGTINMTTGAATIVATGGTIVNNGKIDLAHADAAITVTAPEDIENNGTIETLTATNTVIVGLIAGPTGSGKIVLKGDASLSQLAATAALTQNVEIASGAQLKLKNDETPFSGGKTINIKSGGTLLLDASSATFTGVTIKNNGTISTATTSTNALAALMAFDGDTEGTDRTVASTGNVTTIEAAFTVPEHVTLTTVTGGTFASGSVTVTVDGDWTSAGSGITLAVATALAVNGTLTTGSSFGPTAALSTGQAAFTGTGHLDAKAVTNFTVANLNKLITNIAKVTAVSDGTITALVVPAGKELVLHNSTVVLANSDTVTVHGTLTLSGSTDITLTGVSGASNAAIFTGTAGQNAAAVINIDGTGGINAIGAAGAAGLTDGSAKITISGSYAAATPGGAGAIVIFDTDTTVYVPVSTSYGYLKAEGGTGGSGYDSYSGASGGGGAVIIINGNIYTKGGTTTRDDFTASAATGTIAGSVTIGNAGSDPGVAAAAAGTTAQTSAAGVATNGTNSTATTAGAGGSGGANSGSAGDSSSDAADDATYAGGGGGGEGEDSGTSGNGGGGGAAIVIVV